MRWLDEDSPAAIVEALKQVAPALADYPIAVRESAGEDDPLWWSATAVVGERFVAKFAWSRPAALRLAHEVAVLAALACEPAVPFLPEVVASSTDPLLMVTRLVPGEALFDGVDSLDRDDVGRQLAQFLAELHRSTTRERVEAVVGELPPAALQPAATDALRDRFVKWATLRHYRQITGRELAAERVMAWHLRTALGDALWRSEAGVPLPDHRTPPAWVDDLAQRLTALGYPGPFMY